MTSHPKKTGTSKTLKAVHDAGRVVTYEFDVAAASAQSN